MDSVRYSVSTSYFTNIKVSNCKQSQRLFNFVNVTKLKTSTECQFAFYFFNLRNTAVACWLKCFTTTSIGDFRLCLSLKKWRVAYNYWRSSELYNKGGYFQSRKVKPKAFCH